MSDSIEFLGAYESVTGSKTLIKLGELNILVDCGMYQGEEKKKCVIEPKLNRLASQIDAIFLTHGHLDHCGYLPILEKNGFKGQIFCTHLTAKIATIVLNDSLGVQAYNLKHQLIDEVLFEEEDITKVLSRIKAIDFNEKLNFYGVEFYFQKAGHIIGAASLCLSYQDKKILFSGDIGRNDDLLHQAPEMTDFQPEHLISESTYGNRIHSVDHLELELEKALSSIIENKSILLIPAFAVARTQVLLVLLYRVMTNKLSLEVPIYVDSPMAVKVTHLYQENLKELKDEGEELKDALERVKLIEFGKDHKKLTKADTPYVLISSSGMLEGGKIMKYLEMYGKHENNLIAFSGFQAPGSLGHKINNGEKEIKILGHKMQIRAKTLQLEGLSAHADQAGILEFIKSYSTSLKYIYLNHGDAQAISELKAKLEELFPNLNIIDVAKNIKYEVV